MFIALQSFCGQILSFGSLSLQVDVCGYRRMTIFLEWMGMHALMIYVLAACNVFPIFLQGFYWGKPGNNIVNSLSYSCLILISYSHARLRLYCSHFPSQLKLIGVGTWRETDTYTWYKVYIRWRQWDMLECVLKEQVPCGVHYHYQSFVGEIIFMFLSSLAGVTCMHHENIF